MVAGLVPWLPVQVEVRAASSENQWLEQLRHTIGWADKVCAGVRHSSYGELLRIVRDSRFNIDKGFVQVLGPGRPAVRSRRLPGMCYFDCTRRPDPRLR